MIEIQKKLPDLLKGKTFIKTEQGTGPHVAIIDKEAKLEYEAIEESFYSSIEKS